MAPKQQQAKYEWHASHPMPEQSPERGLPKQVNRILQKRQGAWLGNWLGNRLGARARQRLGHTDCPMRPANRLSAAPAP